MIEHIVCWNIKEELTKEEKLEASRKIKMLLEGLNGKIPGLIDIQVSIEPLNSSTRDLALFSQFSDEESLERYQVHPEHLKAIEYIRSKTQDRIAYDYLKF